MEIRLTGKRRHILSDKEEFSNIQKWGGCLSLWKDSSLDNHLSRISLCSKKIKLDRWFQLFWGKNPVLKQKLKSEPHIQNYHKETKVFRSRLLAAHFQFSGNLRFSKDKRGKPLIQVITGTPKIQLTPMIHWTIRLFDPRVLEYRVGSRKREEIEKPFLKVIYCNDLALW